METGSGGEVARKTTLYWSNFFFGHKPGEHSLKEEKKSQSVAWKSLVKDKLVY